jgi:hypothetical protein
MCPLIVETVVCLQTRLPSHYAVREIRSRSPSLSSSPLLRRHLRHFALRQHLVDELLGRSTQPPSRLHHVHVYALGFFPPKPSGALCSFPRNSIPSTCGAKSQLVRHCQYQGRWCLGKWSDWPSVDAAQLLQYEVHCSS